MCIVSTIDNGNQSMIPPRPRKKDAVGQNVRTAFKNAVIEKKPLRPTKSVRRRCNISDAVSIGNGAEYTAIKNCIPTAEDEIN